MNKGVVITSIAAFVVESVQLLLYFRAVCPVRTKPGTAKWVCCCTAAATAHLVRIFLFRESQAGILFSVAVDLLLVGLLYGGRLLSKCAHLAMFYCIVTASDIVSAGILLLLGGYGYEGYLEYTVTVLDLTGTLLARAISMLLVLPASRRKTGKGAAMHWMTAAGMMVHTVLGVYIALDTFVYAWEREAVELLRVQLYLLAALLGVNWLLLCWNRREDRAAREADRYRMLLHSQEQRLSEIEGKVLEMRKSHHDFRHHLVYLSEALLGGEWMRALSYVFTLRKRSEQTAPQAITGNFTIDAILAGLRKVCLEKGISFYCAGSVPEVRIEPVDLTGIIGNLVENSIHACEKLDGGKDRWIRVKFSHHTPDTLAIQVSNPCIDYSPGRSGEGLGLLIVQELARKHGGDMEAVQKSGVFRVSVILIESDD